MTPDEIMRLCDSVGDFSRSNDWRFKAKPVIVWEFSTIGEYARARMDILRAMQDLLKFSRTDDGWQRAISSEVTEIDCMGVTFRLVCAEKTMNPFDVQIRMVLRAQFLTTARYVERHLHRHFRETHHRGEWFSLMTSEVRVGSCNTKRLRHPRSISSVNRKDRRWTT